MNISTLDLVIIVAYLIGITAIGILVGYRKKATSKEYFLAGKSLGWFTIGSAMFASNISTIHLVGLAAAGASVGHRDGQFRVDGLVLPDRPGAVLRALLLPQRHLRRCRSSSNAATAPPPAPSSRRSRFSARC